MANYTIETKPAFTVLGLGTVLTGDYSQLPQQKAAFWQQASGDWLNSVQGINDYAFAVNEAYDGEMRFYAGRQVSAETPADGADQRLIAFPAGHYLVLRGTAADSVALFGALEGQAFGEVLPALKDYAYVGGPNTTVQMGQTATGVQGEMWIPLAQK